MRIVAQCKTCKYSHRDQGDSKSIWCAPQPYGPPKDCPDYEELVPEQGYCVWVIHVREYQDDLEYAIGTADGLSLVNAQWLAKQWPDKAANQPNVLKTPIRCEVRTTNRPLMLETEQRQCIHNLLD